MLGVDETCLSNTKPTPRERVGVQKNKHIHSRCQDSRLLQFAAVAAVVAVVGKFGVVQWWPERFGHPAIERDAWRP